MATANLRDLGEVVDGARTGCARGGHYTKWLVSSRQIVLDRLFQFCGLHLQTAVHRDPAQRPPADSQQTGGLVQGMMSLGRSIKDMPATDGSDAILNKIRKTARHRHCAEVSF